MSYQKIHPYKKGDAWIFNDPQHGLIAEPLVDGTDDLCDMICNIYHIDPLQGMQVNFATRHDDLFVDGGHPVKIFELIFVGPSGGGTLYSCRPYDIHTSICWCEDQVIWLCENLLKYFESPPETIYFNVSEVDAVFAAKRIVLPKRLVYCKSPDIHDFLTESQCPDSLNFAKQFPSVDWINYHIM